MNLDFAPVFADFDALVRGAVVTVEVTAGALLLGCVIGLLVGAGLHMLHRERLRARAALEAATD